jgi:hypothetical protein
VSLTAGFSPRENTLRFDLDLACLPREPIETPAAVAAVVRELRVPAIGAFALDSDAAAI